MAAAELDEVKPEALWAQTMNSSAISQLTASTAQSVAKQVVGELTSWGMASLGFPGTDGTAKLESLLKKVAAELATIE
ncbi:hypothetical protein HW44_01010 [Nitrosococcus oceani]|nr:hypothetical protein HW44_01010 [Nitrosococcus oceani]